MGPDLSSPPSVPPIRTWASGRSHIVGFRGRSHIVGFRGRSHIVGFRGRSHIVGFRVLIVSRYHSSSSITRHEHTHQHLVVVDHTASSIPGIAGHSPPNEFSASLADFSYLFVPCFHSSSSITRLRASFQLVDHTIVNHNVWHRHLNRRQTKLKQNASPGGRSWHHYHNGGPGPTIPSSSATTSCAPSASRSSPTLRAMRVRAALAFTHISHTRSSPTLRDIIPFCVAQYIICYSSLTDRQCQTPRPISQSPMTVPYSSSLGGVMWRFVFSRCSDSYILSSA